MGFEILKCSYLKILKNVSFFRSLDLILACSSMVLSGVNEKKERESYKISFGAVWSYLELFGDGVILIKSRFLGPKNNMVSELSRDNCGTFGDVFEDLQALWGIFNHFHRAFTVF